MAALFKGRSSRVLKNPGDETGTRGVALLIVLMLILGLLILGQAAMLSLDQIAQRSGTYRRQQQGNYCAEEGLNLARAWLLKALNGATVLNPILEQQLLADPSDPTNDATGMHSATKDLCQIVTVPGPPAIAGLSGLCRTDPSSGLPMYQINLIDDIDEQPPNIDPFHDTNNVFFLRAECLANSSVLRPNSGLQQSDVAMVEVNQSAASSCYGMQSGANPAGCGLRERPRSRSPKSRRSKPTPGAKLASMPRRAPPKKRSPSTKSRAPARKPTSKPSSKKRSRPAGVPQPSVVRKRPASPPAHPAAETVPDEIRPLAMAAIEAALDKKAERPTLLDVRRLSSYADYVLVLSGDSERQLSAISRAIQDKLRALGKRARGIEAGAGESSWLLMDFGDLVIHVFLREARDFYDLEGLWADAPRVPVGSVGTSLSR
jgi:ribosome-associated protein